MEGEKIPEVILNSGRKMPLIGMGTAVSALPPPDLLNASLIDAINVGYRHFDTASLYGTEESLGQAIADALQIGLIKARDDVFITSKLWCSDADGDLVLPALKSSLQKLRLDYIDLYLIHYPMRLKQGVTYKFMEDDILPFNMKGTWEAMEECCRLGLTKSIGVSNFSCQKLTQLLANATIPPAVNQVELNPGWQQRKMREFCKENGIHVSAWSPLGAYGTLWGSNAVMENPILKDIAMAKGKSIAQVSLRWIYQQGVGLIVKSFNKERMKENLQIFDWGLSEDELQKINQIPQRRNNRGEKFVSPNGPYKTVEEIWDGEI